MADKDQWKKVLTGDKRDAYLQTSHFAKYYKTQDI